MEVKENLVRTMKPGEMIKWAHSVVDTAENLLSGSSGLLGGCRFNCDTTASPTNLIFPIDTGEYLDFRQRQKQLIQQAVDVIYRCLQAYSTERMSLGKSVEKTLEVLSLCDIDDFKRCMQSQVWFSVIHAAIDEIEIIILNKLTTSTYTTITSSPPYDQNTRPPPH
jgi:hypothetical protein